MNFSFTLRDDDYFVVEGDAGLPKGNKTGIAIKDSLAIILRTCEFEEKNVEKHFFFRKR
jgi:hypothetical protein